MTAPGSAWPSSHPSPRSTAAPSPPAPATTAACPSRSPSPGPAPRLAPRPAPRRRAPAFRPPKDAVFHAQADIGTSSALRALPPGHLGLLTGLSLVPLIPVAGGRDCGGRQLPGFGVLVAAPTPPSQA